MPQLHLYVSKEISDRVAQRAASVGISVSSLLATIVEKEVSAGWPDGYFEKIVGGWHGGSFERPAQGRYEERQPFDDAE